MLAASSTHVAVIQLGAILLYSLWGLMVAAQQQLTVLVATLKIRYLCVPATKEPVAVLTSCGGIFSHLVKPCS
ncbi:hypothetical protein EDD17DRAFT_343958 [Pisolithus thermaeus]|nr:hypothetical protein EDD17DRAFT_343958 [Pisolithus thermaeus]